MAKYEWENKSRSCIGRRKPYDFAVFSQLKIEEVS